MKACSHLDGVADTAAEFRDGGQVQLAQDATTPQSPMGSAAAVRLHKAIEQLLTATFMSSVLPVTSECSELLSRHGNKSPFTPINDLPYFGAPWRSPGPPIPFPMSAGKAIDSLHT